MAPTAALRKRSFPSTVSISILVLFLLLVIYYQITTTAVASDPLVYHLTRATGIDAPSPIFQEAIRLAAKDLAEELEIDLENYDLTREEYESLVQAVAEKFSFCEQYRLTARLNTSYPCHLCTTRPQLILKTNQTFKIGQTCLQRKGRYGKELPAPNLVYQKEFTGNIFEVLVAEHVKLLLFRYGVERKTILKNNNLPDTELLLPPGNKMLR